MELCACIQGGERKRIAIICMLHHVRYALVSFLRWSLPYVMQTVRVAAGLPVDDDIYGSCEYERLEQLGILCVTGPVWVRGQTVDVGF